MKKQDGSTLWRGKTLRYAGISDQGLVRRANEDDFIILPENAFFCVADGMGGHEAGALASRLTTNSVAEYMAFLDDPKEATLPNGLTEGMLMLSPLEGIIQFANSQVYHAAAGRTMGSTLVAIHFIKNGISLAHVGDSRAYLWRGGMLRQLTEDHSLVNELFKMKIITQDEMRDHPNRNVITRAIGSSIHLEPTVQYLEIMPGDMLLLCTDGLTSMVREEKIIQALHSGDDLLVLAQALTEFANQEGGRDNITIILVSVQ